MYRFLMYVQNFNMYEIFNMYQNFKMFNDVVYVMFFMVCSNWRNCRNKKGWIV